MKRISTLLCAFVFVFAVNKLDAQNLLAQNPTTHLSGPANQLLTANVTILNNGSNATYVKVARIGQNLAAGQITYFCWTVCYDPTTSVSPDSIFLAPGASTSIFNGDVNPLGYEGSSDVSYAFFNSNGDSAFATFSYDFFATGINELSGRANLNASPNPANNYTKVAYNLNSSKDAKIVIYNMLGSAVKEIKLNDVQNTVTISTADFKQGIYFYSLLVDGKAISSKKLIVSHN